MTPRCDNNPPDQRGMLLLIKKVLKITASFMAPDEKEIPNNLLKEERRMGFTIRMGCGFKMRIILGIAPLYLRNGQVPL